MDGINPIHLAARFHAQSLLLIVQVLHDNDLMESMMDIFEGVDPHMGKTPLHLAINSPNHLNTVIMLTCGVDIEAKDNRGSYILFLISRKKICNFFS